MPLMIAISPSYVLFCSTTAHGEMPLKAGWCIVYFSRSNDPDEYALPLRDPARLVTDYLVGLCTCAALSRTVVLFTR